MCMFLFQKPNRFRYFHSDSFLCPVPVHSRVILRYSSMAAARLNGPSNSIRSSRRRDINCVLFSLKGLDRKKGNSDAAAKLYGPLVRGGGRAWPLLPVAPLPFLLLFNRPVLPSKLNRQHIFWFRWCHFLVYKLIIYAEIQVLPKWN